MTTTHELTRAELSSVARWTSDLPYAPRPRYPQNMGWSHPHVEGPWAFPVDVIQSACPGCISGLCVYMQLRCEGKSRGEFAAPMWKSPAGCAVRSVLALPSCIAIGLGLLMRREIKRTFAFFVLCVEIDAHPHSNDPYYNWPRLVLPFKHPPPQDPLLLPWQGLQPSPGRLIMR